MILGHERQLEYLDKAAKRGRLSHAYLFYGPEQVGKFTVAKFFAEKLGSSGPIILDTEHTFVSKKEIRKDIPIEDIRELKRRLALAPASGEMRVVIINQAERMSLDAANSFLKLLEEPGERVLFILVTSSVELLLPTIVSRAQPIRFFLISDRTIDNFLKGKLKDEDLCRAIKFYAFGRPGLVMRLLEDKNALEKERKFKNMFSAALSGNIHDALGFTGKIYEDEELRAKAAEYLLRSIRASILANPSQGRVLAKKIKNIDRIQMILSTTNVNPRLALDVMLFEGIQPNPNPWLGALR